MAFLLQTGPNHPGATLFVQKRDGKSGFDMTERRDRAEEFKTVAAAQKRAKTLSSLYGLRVIPAN